GTTNFLVTPIYTKNLAFNSSVVYSQVSFVGGGGAAYFITAGVQPVFDFGLVIRYYLGQHSALKFDFRDYIFPTAYQSNNLTLILGYAISLGEGYGRL